MPPLRERREDIVLLAEHFLERTRADYSLPPLSLAPDAREGLRASSWPGNVRELANVIERAVLLGDATRITATALGIAERPAEPAPLPAEAPARSSAMASREDVMREHLRTVLRSSGGNITRAAEVLGVSRSTVRAQIRRFGLRADEAEGPPERRVIGRPHAVQPPAEAAAIGTTPHPRVQRSGPCAGNDGGSRF